MPPGMTTWRSSPCPTTASWSARTKTAGPSPGTGSRSGNGTARWSAWGRSWASPSAPLGTSISWTRRTRPTAMCCWTPRALTTPTPPTPCTSAPRRRCWRSLPTWGRRRPMRWWSPTPSWWPPGVTTSSPCPTGSLPPSWRTPPRSCTTWSGARPTSSMGRTRPRSSRTESSWSCPASLSASTMSSTCPPRSWSRTPWSTAIWWAPGGRWAPPLWPFSRGSPRSTPCLPTTAAPSVSTRILQQGRPMAAGRTCPTRCAPCAGRPM
ncbi:unknown [Firmicutes bacterium CAG:114]|nr:unknown [Firmicutes bacterium CAG:114]